jgi:hypothetical protein
MEDYFMKKMLLTVMLCCFVLPGLIMAQGTTTSAFSGQVTDIDGNPVVGATISVLHTPTGTVYTAISRQDGQYNIPAVKAGGPYTVTVIMDPFKTQELKGIIVKLGENRSLKFKLVLETISEVITVTASNPVISESRTGASQNVSQELIQNLPTITRSLSDFTRMSPQVLNNEETDGAFNAGGRSSRYNNIQIDGAQSNDLFGLGATGTPGSQSESTVISLDAVQEFQVVVAPYDVRQGMFTGGGVNIITKSGRNKAFGSLFYEGRNKSLVGKGIDGLNLADFTDGVFGGSFGGPIVKDKLFFFVNGELENKKTPLDYYVDGSGASFDFGSLPEVQRFVQILQNKYGYDAGSYGQMTAKKNKLNLFGRIDWNINNNNRLTLRSSILSSDMESLSRTSNSSFNLGNAGVIYQTRSHSTVLQIDSTLSQNLFNQLIINYQHVQDTPTYMGTAFPSISVKISGNKTLYAGSEQYRHINILKQDLIEITDNMTLFKGNHTLTFGTHNEIFKFYNAYVQFAFGKYGFNSLDDLEAGKASSYDRYYSLTDDPNTPSKFSVFQLGLYGMDEWKVSPKLKLTLGLRADVPIFPDTPYENPKVEAAFGIPTNQTPTGNILWSPRLGFNYQIGENQDMQIRGGIGIFSGRTPYVWISNQYGNTGVDLGRYQLFSSITFRPDINNQYTNPSPVYDGDICLNSKDYRFPQVMRTSLAIDKKLPFGFTGTVEFVYSKTVKDIFYQNINIAATGAVNTFDGRPLFGKQSTAGGSSTKYGTPTWVNKNFKNVLLLTNTNQGYTWNASIQLQKEWGAAGNSINLVYSFGRAKDVSTPTSSRAISNWQYNMTQGDPNKQFLFDSVFDPGQRILFAISKRFDFFKNAPTNLSVVYNGHSGARYSTIFYNDVNGDGALNDLMWVPKSADQIILTKGTWEQLDAYIKSDPGLEKYRGQILPRASSRENWYNGCDLRLAQQIPVPIATGHRVEVYLSVKNFFNMLNKKWGVFRYFAYEDAPLTFMGYDSATGKPKFEFYGKTDSADLTNNDFRYTINQMLSRWQMLLGVNYRF